MVQSEIWRYTLVGRFWHQLEPTGALCCMIWRRDEQRHRYTRIQVCLCLSCMGLLSLTPADLSTASFHPDGHLFAAGGTDGQIKFFHVKTGENAGVNFELDGPVQDVAFSENGYWFAAVAKDSTNVVVFDIRKEGKAAEAKVLEIGGQVDCIKWDYTGQFLVAAGPGGLTISNYTKSSKSWSDVISLAVPAVALEWGPEAKTLVTANEKGVVSVLGSE